MPAFASSPPSLLVISTAPAGMRDGKLVLDRKFVEGMRLYAEKWNGPVGCLLPDNFSDQLFTGTFDPASIPFEVRLHPRTRRVTATELDGYDVVLCSGDSEQHLHLAELCKRVGKPVFFTIENIPETRRQIVMLDRKKSLLKKMKSVAMVHYHERRRRRAFALADGLQANGYPAARRYRADNANVLLYLDNRIDAGLLGTQAEMAARRDRLMAGKPLRLIHSGRLEPLKGSQDLVPIACRLRDQGVDFVLDIFGGGSLEGDIRAEISRCGLQNHVRLRGVADFATELVPHARKNSDIFVSCHRQSDPSCSYLENMGCGLAIIGYDNRMWDALARESGAGWALPLGHWRALADRLASLDKDRLAIAKAADNARRFSGQHLLEREFDMRVRFLKDAVTPC